MAIRIGSRLGRIADLEPNSHSLMGSYMPPVEAGISGFEACPVRAGREMDGLGRGDDSPYLGPMLTIDCPPGMYRDFSTGQCKASPLVGGNFLNPPQVPAFTPTVVRTISPSHLKAALPVYVPRDRRPSAQAAADEGRPPPAEPVEKGYMFGLSKNALLAIGGAAALLLVVALR